MSGSHPDVTPHVTMTSGNPDLSDDERRRYGRHLVMPEVGLEGQKKLKAARVLCVGAGGLGSPAAIYLAAAGVGTIGIVDHDVVDFSNLHRQILHTTDDVGRPKLDSARDHLEALNSEIEVRLHDGPLSSSNAIEIIEGYDIVIDGTDNFASRYLISDACVLSGRPDVYGSIFRFDGQAAVFCAPEGPCYRCLYPEPPKPGQVPNCEEAGVLGVLPGIIGTLQATEAIKLILGLGEPLVGRLFLFDALRMQSRTLRVARNPECPVCGERPTIRELIDYEAFCGVTMMKADPTDMNVIELKEAIDRKDDFFLLDCREPHEYEISKIPGSVLIPMGEIRDRMDDLDPDRDIVVYCRSGSRSAMVAAFLRREGFRARNLAGGVNEWVARVDPSQPRY